MKNREKIARTIAGLYNRAQSFGMGALNYVPGKMSVEEAGAHADRCIKEGTVYFDWLHGRVMKVEIDMSGEVIDDFRLYDRDNGAGAGARAIADGLADPFYAPLGTT